MTVIIVHGERKWQQKREENMWHSSPQILTPIS